MREGEDLRVRITFEATMNGRYVHSIAPHKESGAMVETTLEEQVDRIIKETIISGLLTTYLDGSGEAIWIDGAEVVGGEHWEWQPVESAAQLAARLEATVTDAQAG